mgnify:CR=1 FL=1
METLIKLVTVFGLGAIELWVGIPTGIALQLHPLVAGAVAALGALFGMILVLIIGERIRNWLLRQHKRRSEGEFQGSLNRIWARYGVVGLGLLTPLLVGAPLGTAIGVTLGVPTSRLLLWMSIGIILWSCLLTIAITVGIVAMNTAVS